MVCAWRFAPKLLPCKGAAARVTAVERCVCSFRGSFLSFSLYQAPNQRLYTGRLVCFFRLSPLFGYCLATRAGDRRSVRVKNINSSV
jgi:hypothetical protein